MDLTDDRMNVKVLELKEKVLANNDAEADRLRAELKENGIFYANIMSSPGSGKTTTLLATSSRLREDFHIGVMEADIDSDVDAKTVAAAGFHAVQLHTGGMCHLTADMSRQGLAALGPGFDLVFLENVGNLVCPAEFDTGAQMNIVILSVPEGDDKPLKYPLMFEKADVVLINKTDAMELFDFRMESVIEAIHARKAGIPVFAVSAETGDGMDAWCAWFKSAVAAYREN